MELFSIKCTTCSARLKVRDTAAIGQILECPRCSSMVMVSPPPGWTPPPEKPAVSESAAADKPEAGTSAAETPVANQSSAAANPASPRRARQSTGNTSDSDSRSAATPPRDDSPSAPGAPGERPLASPTGPAHAARNPRPSSAKESQQASATETKQASSKESEQVSAKESKQTPGANAKGVSPRKSAIAAAAAAGMSLDDPTSAAESAAPGIAADTPSEGAGADQAAETGFSDGGTTPSSLESALSPAELQARKWGVLGGGSVAAVILVVGVAWSIWGGAGEVEPIPENGAPHAAATNPQDDSPDKDAPSTSSDAPIAPLDWRWIPDGAVAVLSVQRAALADDAAASPLARRLRPLWERELAALRDGLGIPPESIDRLSWAATDLASPNEHRVVVVQLNADAATAGESTSGNGPPSGNIVLHEAQPTGLKFGDVDCLQRTDGAWPLPFVLINRRTLISAPRELMIQLRDRLDPRWESPAMGQLARKVKLQHDLTFIADLKAVRAAEFDMPTLGLQHWDAGRSHWRQLHSVPEGAALSLDIQNDELQTEITLLCADEAMASDVKLALDGFLKDGRSAVGEAVRSQANDPAEAAGGPAVSNSLALLQFASSWLDGVSLEADGRFVLVRSHAALASSDSALAALSPTLDGVAMQTRQAGPVEAPDAEPNAAAPRKSPVTAKIEPFAAPMVENPFQEQLAAKLPEIDFRNARLDNLIEFLSQITVAPIELDIDALADLGVTPETQSTVHLKQTTAGDALQSILTQHGLATIVDGKRLLVTSARRRRETRRELRYPIDDLTEPTDAAAEDFAGLVRRLVLPDSWRTAEGPAVIDAAAGQLTVHHHDDAHGWVLALCEKLRVARGLPLRSKANPARFQLETLARRAAPRLMSPVTIRQPQPTPLSRIAELLQARSGVSIRIDVMALRNRGQDGNIETTLTVSDEPLFSALTTLGESVEMALRIVDPRTVQLTSIEKARSILELEFYRLGDLLADKAPPKELLDRIAESVDPASWIREGGRGVMHFDAQSRCLIVLQPQHVHWRLEEWLATQREMKNDDEPPDGSAPSEQSGKEAR